MHHPKRSAPATALPRSLPIGGSRPGDGAKTGASKGNLFSLSRAELVTDVTAPSN